MAWWIVFTGAIGTVLMRNLKKLKHPMTVGMYTSFTSIFVMSMLATIANQDLEVFKEFSPLDYFYMIVAGILLVVA